MANVGGKGLLFVAKYVFRIGVLPSGDKICDKNNSKRHCQVKWSLFCCLRVGYCIHLDSILLTPCLDLLCTGKHSLKLSIQQQFHNGNV